MKSFGAFFLIVMLIYLVSLYMKAKLEKSNKSETIMYKEVPTAFLDTQYDQKPDKLYKNGVWK